MKSMSGKGLPLPGQMPNCIACVSCYSSGEQACKSEFDYKTGVKDIISPSTLTKTEFRGAGHWTCAESE